MYELSSEKAESLLNEADKKDQQREQHYLFANKSVEGLEQITEFYSVIMREEESHMLHVDKNSRNEEKNIDTAKVVSALKQEGYRPFLKLDITRNFLDHKGQHIVIEQIENLGAFISEEEMGGRKAFYGDILLEKMNSDSESREQVIKEAREIL